MNPSDDDDDDDDQNKDMIKRKHAYAGFRDVAMRSSVRLSVDRETTY